MKKIKFRAWNYRTKSMMDNFELLDISLRSLSGFGDYQLALMQFTDLYDEESKEIYEGDILSGIVLNGSIQHCVVEFKNGCFVAQQYKGEKIWNELYNDIKYAKIIGNIYENGDLIK